MSTTAEPKLNWDEVGVYIANVRKQRGMSQAEFAEKIGRKQPDVSVIEKGARQSTVETMWKIAEALDIQPQTLFSKFEEKQAQETACN